MAEILRNFPSFGVNNEQPNIPIRNFPEKTFRYNVACNLFEVKGQHYKKLIILAFYYRQKLHPKTVLLKLT